MGGALAGVRVLDLSRVLAGPWATQLLADMGADVVKVEHPDGDETRRWVPPVVEGARGRAESAYFLAANRAKQSICIDFARPEGQQLVCDLAADADVVIENYRVGALARYGLDAASLCALNPRLIYCSISGFGQDGPRAAEPGYDFVVQGMSGLMSVTGEGDGPPLKVGVALVDIMTGLYAANAVQGALIARQRTGRGQHIDLALFDVGLAMLGNQALNFLATGRSPARLGNAHPNIVPYESFAAGDGEITLAVGSNRQFRSLCGVLGELDIADDPRFATNAARVANRDILIPLLAGLIGMRQRGELLAALGRAGVPAGPINTIADAFADAQALHRGALVSLPHTTLGAIAAVACPVHFSRTPVEYRHGPPVLGEHSVAILRDRLNLSPADIAGLLRSGVVRAHLDEDVRRTVP